MLLRGVAQNRVRRLFEVDRGGGAGTFQISGIDHRSLSDFRLPFTETLQVGGVSGRPGASGFDLIREDSPIVGQQEIDFKTPLIAEEIEIGQIPGVQACLHGFNNNHVLEEIVEPRIATDHIGGVDYGTCQPPAAAHGADESSAK